MAPCHLKSINSSLVSISLLLQTSPIRFFYTLLGFTEMQASLGPIYVPVILCPLRIHQKKVLIAGRFEPSTSQVYTGVYTHRTMSRRLFETDLVSIFRISLGTHLKPLHSKSLLYVFLCMSFLSVFLICLSYLSCFPFFSLSNLCSISLYLSNCPFIFCFFIL